MRIAKRTSPTEDSQEPEEHKKNTLYQKHSTTSVTAFASNKCNITCKIYTKANKPGFHKRSASFPSFSRLLSYSTRGWWPIAYQRPMLAIAADNDLSLIIKVSVHFTTMLVKCFQQRSKWTYKNEPLQKK